MSLFNLITVVGLALFIIAACAFVFAKGSPGERYGAGMYAIFLVGGALYEGVSGQAAPALAMLGVDLAIAIGFLVLAVRYNNLWMGGAMILQGIAFGLHVSRLTEAVEPRIFGLHFYVLALNVIAILIIFIMIGATISAMHRKKHPLQEDDDHLWEPAPKA
jgi:hypothetical protein